MTAFRLLSLATPLLAPCLISCLPATATGLHPASPLQLCDGASEAERAALRLKPAKAFRYLNQSNCFDLRGVSNAEEYRRTRRSMSVVGIPEVRAGGVVGGWLAGWLGRLVHVGPCRAATSHLLSCCSCCVL